MKKTILTLAIIASAMFTAFAPSASAAPKTPPPPIECQNTHWVATVNSGWQDDISFKILAQVDTLRDTNDNAYCGQIRGHTGWQAASGNMLCYYFYVEIWDGVPPAAETLLARRWSALTCSGTSSILNFGESVADDGITHAWSWAGACTTQNVNGTCIVPAESPESYIIS